MTCLLACRRFLNWSMRAQAKLATTKGSSSFCNDTILRVASVFWTFCARERLIWQNGRFLVNCRGDLEISDERTNLPMHPTAKIQGPKPMRRVKRTRMSLGYSPIADLKLGFRPDEVVFMLGSSQLFAEMVAAKWLVPVVNRHKLQVYDRGDLARAWARIRNGEQPPRLRKWRPPA